MSAAILIFLKERLVEVRISDIRESDVIILKNIKRVSEDFIKKNYPDIYQRVLDYVSDRMKSYSFLHKLIYDCGNKLYEFDFKRFKLWQR